MTTLTTSLGAIAALVLVGTAMQASPAADELRQAAASRFLITTNCSACIDALAARETIFASMGAADDALLASAAVRARSGVAVEIVVSSEMERLRRGVLNHMKSEGVRIRTMDSPPTILLIDATVKAPPGAQIRTELVEKSQILGD